VAGPREPRKQNAQETPDTAGSALARIANLLALILTKGEAEAEKVKTLAAVGFSAPEIGSLLGKQSNTVSVILYQARKKPSASRKYKRRA